MGQTTITEALADVKTIKARLAKKQAAMANLVTRAAAMVDPMANQDGGSAGYLQRERQACHDLRERLVLIRAAIQVANAAATIALGGTTRTVAAWLVWRRDVAPMVEAELQVLGQGIQTGRASAGRDYARDRDLPADTAQGALVVNLDEAALLAAIEQFTEQWGDLDGKLALHNATALIELP